jgi:hypothetical protein
MPEPQKKSYIAKSFFINYGIKLIKIKHPIAEEIGKLYKNVSAKARPKNEKLDNKLSSYFMFI